MAAAGPRGLDQVLTTATHPRDAAGDRKGVSLERRVASGRFVGDRAGGRGGAGVDCGRCWGAVAGDGVVRCNRSGEGRLEGCRLSAMATSCWLPSTASAR